MILSVYQKPYLDNSYDYQLFLPGYNLIRADNPSNIKRGGVYIYYHETLPVKVINVNVLNEYLVCDLSFGSRRVCLVSIYRSPSQSSNEYDTFLVNFRQRVAYLNSLKPQRVVSNRRFQYDIFQQVV